MRAFSLNGFKLGSFNKIVNGKQQGIAVGELLYFLGAGNVYACVGELSREVL